MSFNPDLNLVQKSSFFMENDKIFHSQICFNILLIYICRNLSELKTEFLLYLLYLEYGGVVFVKK